MAKANVRTSDKRGATMKLEKLERAINEYLDKRDALWKLANSRKWEIHLTISRRSPVFGGTYGDSQTPWYYLKNAIENDKDQLFQLASVAMRDRLRELKKEIESYGLELTGEGENETSAVL